MSSNPVVNTANPAGKPLGELYFSVNTANGVCTKIPALSRHWLEPRVHAAYLPVPADTGAGAAELDEWLAETGAYVEELEWLLRMEHFRFWSHMTLDPGCIGTVVSFLQEATPFYTPLATLTADTVVHQRYALCLRLTLRLLFRLLADRESPSAWIARDHHAKLLYSNFLITIPICFDVLLACGRTNAALLRQLLDRVLGIDRRYLDDLREALVFMKKTLLGIGERVAENATADDAGLADLAAFALDCSATVAVLLECSVEAVRAAGDVQLEQALSGFYDQTVPALYKQIHEVSAVAPALLVLQQCRAELLGAFRSVVEQFLKTVYEEPANSMLPAEYFLAIMQEALSDPVFVIDYKRLYPVQEDFDAIRQACPELDMVNVEFLRKAYTTTSDAHFLTTTTYPPPASPQRRNSIQNGAASLPSTSASASTASAAAVSTASIQSVRDILPDLQPDFVAALLQRYSGDPEQAIAAVLEGNLPPDLQPDTFAAAAAAAGAAFTSAGPSSAAPAPAAKPAPTDPNDPFNFGSRSVIVKRSKGFPGEARNLAALLDDKSHVQQLRGRYQQWGLVPEEGGRGAAGGDVEGNDYDDEYDDSYEALADSERRGGVTRATAVRNPNRAVRDELCDEAEDEEEESEEEEETEQEGGQQQQQASGGGSGRSSYYDRTKNFCENPEVLRERRAQQWNNKWAARGGGGGGGGGAARRPAAAGPGQGQGQQQRQQTTTGGDVIGKPRGQGQDATTQRSRAKKEAGKTTKANHSRRQGAAWKRNTGMIPS